MVALNVAAGPLVRAERRAAALRLIGWPRRLSLAGQFLLASFVVLVIGMLVIGTWVGSAIERGVLNRSASVTALYVNSILSDYRAGLGGEKTLTPADMATFDRLLAETPLGKHIVAFKV